MEQRRLKAIEEAKNPKKSRSGPRKPEKPVEPELLEPVEEISKIEERRREPDLFKYGHPTDALEAPVYLFYPPPADEMHKMMQIAFVAALAVDKKRKKEEKK